MTQGNGYPPRQNGNTPGGDGQPPQAPYNAFPFGTQCVQGNGQLAIGATIGKSYSLLFRNFLPTLGFNLLVGFILGLAIFAAGVSAFFLFQDVNEKPSFGLAFSLIGLFVVIGMVFAVCVSMWLSNGALQAAEARKLRFTDFFRLKYSFWVAFAVSFLIALPSVVVGVLPNANLQADGTIDINFIWIEIIIALVVTFVAPLYILAPYRAIDEDCSIGEAFRFAFETGKQNYLPILGLSILQSIITGFSLMFIIGGLVTVPASAIGMGLAYRQLSRGVHERLG